MNALLLVYWSEATGFIKNFCSAAIVPPRLHDDETDNRPKSRENRKGEMTMPLLPKGSIPLVLVAMLIVSSTVGADEALSDVRGTVTYKLGPITNGRIFFHIGDDQFVGAKIKDGKYSVTRVPLGTWRVTIDGKGVPAKYGSEEQSELALTTTKGKLAFDVAIQDDKFQVELNGTRSEVRVEMSQTTTTRFTTTNPLKK